MKVTAVEADAATYAALAADAARRGRICLVVRDPASAADALRLALQGSDLLLHATAARRVLDRLYEDLRRLTPVKVLTGPQPLQPGDRLDDDGRDLLQLLAQGLSVTEAAEALHLSLRTANRRLAAARAQLGVATTIEAIASLSAGSSPDE